MSDVMTQHAFLDVPVEIKADQDESGLFVARVSAFGNKDRNGDRVLKGAFTRTLGEWRQKSAPIPVVWSHGHANPEDFIGSADANNIRETEKGLDVPGKLNIEGSARAASVFELMKAGLVTAWSFAFVARDEAIGKDGVREIKDLDLFEIGPTLIGANPEAQTLALKSYVADHIDQIVLETQSDLETKRGRRISAATAGVLTRMRQELDELLADGSEDDEDAEAKAASEPLTQSDRLRLELAELDAYLSQRGR